MNSAGTLLQNEKVTKVMFSLIIGCVYSITLILKCNTNAAACYNHHQELWKRVITDTASRPSLAGCYWTDSVPSGCNSLSVSARHGSSVPDWTVYACHCVSKSSWRSSVRYNQQLGRTALQTVNLRHPCVQCRWSSLLECFTGLSRQIFRSMFLNTSLKHVYFVDTDTSTTVVY